MGHLSSFAKMQNQRPKENSKRQKELTDNPKKVNIIACRSCQAINISLIKATDSYYCKFCFEKLNKQKFNKGE